MNIAVITILLTHYLIIFVLCSHLAPGLFSIVELSGCVSRWLYQFVHYCVSNVYILQRRCMVIGCLSDGKLNKLLYDQIRLFCM